ncbi:hypothetical protein [Flavobacterium facile]|uniref:hypothetical protein n=1 Tax=Flavobacterium facile TaxID=2893174 RepID=UPI002E7611DE|nr:hypothetical protein [Flavobacterium sp. T-12]
MKVMFLVLLFSVVSIAQTEEKVKSENKIEAGFEGILGLSYNERIVALHVGGPSFKYKLSSNFKIGMGAFPSLIMLDDKVMPRLGFSPIIEYKKWNFIAPYYGFDSKNSQLWSFGLGYKFS